MSAPLGRVVIVASRPVGAQLAARLRELRFDVAATDSVGVVRDRLRDLAPDLLLVESSLAADDATLEALRAACGLVWIGPVSGARASEPSVDASIDERSLALTLHAAVAKQQSTRALRAEDGRRRVEERYAATVENLLDAIISVDAEQRIVAFNRAAERLFGYGADEVLGHSLELLLPSDLRRLHRHHIDRYRDGEGKARRMGGARRLTVRRRDGAELSVEASIWQMARDHEVLLTVMMRDVTQQALLEEQLKRARNVEVLSRVSSAALHDINNLLTAIRTASDLARRCSESGATPHFDAIDGAIDRGAKLIRKVLAHAGATMSEAVDVEIDSVVRGLRDLARTVAGPSVSVSFALAAADARVRIDPTRLEQVVLNCVANARDALAGGGKVMISTALRLEHDAPHVAIVVRDDGAGIPADVLPRVFEPFFTTKEPTRGTGLGLWASRETVRDAGGKIVIDSEVGRGTSVMIMLPLIVPAATAARVGTPLRPTARRVSVLVVDDEEALRDLLTRSLRLFGYDAAAAGDLDEALAYARAEVVDVLVADLAMPTVRGAEVAERLRALLPRLCVVYMTGHADEEVARLRLDPRVDAVIFKPFAGSELASRIAALLDRQAPRDVT